MNGEITPGWRLLTIAAILSLISLSNNSFAQQSTPIQIEQARKYHLMARYDTTVQIYHSFLDSERSANFSLDTLGHWYSEYAKALSEIDRYDEAISILDSVISVLSEEEDQALYGLGKLHFRLGNTFIFKDRFAAAKSHLQQAIDYFETLQPAARVDIAQAIGSQSHIHFRKKQIDSAFERSRTAIQILEEEHALDTEAAIAVLNSMGVLHHARDDNKRALDYFRETYRLMETFYDPSHPNLGILLNNMATLFLDLNQLDSTAHYIKKVIRINERHGTVRMRIMGYYNMSAFYLRRGDYERAKTYIKTAERLAIEEYGKDHPFLALIYTALSGFHSDIGQFLLAREYSEKALEIRLKIYDSTHEELLSNYFSLGTIYYNQDEFRKSVDIMRDIAIWNHLHGKRSSTLGHLEAQLGQTYLALRQLDSAEYFIKQSLISYGQSLPEHHPYFAWCFNKLSRVHSLSNRWDRALALSDRAFLIHNPDHTPPELGEKWPEPGTYVDFHYINELCLDRAQIYLDRYEEKKDYTDLERAEQVLYHLQDIFTYREPLLYGQVNEALSAESWRKLYEKLFRLNFFKYQRQPDDRYLARMWELADKSKSKLFKWSVQNETAIRFSGIPDSLQGLESDLKEEISRYENELVKQVPDKEPAERLFELKSRYSDLLEHLSVNYPEYFKLKYAEDPPVSLDQLQVYAAKHKTALLEFTYAGDELFVFTATRDTTFVHAYTGDKHPLLNVDTIYAKTMSDKGDFDRWASKTGAYLLSPLREILNTTDHLTIIPDRQLNFLPFDALILPGTDQYLLMEHALQFRMCLPTAQPVRAIPSAEKYSIPLLAVAPGFDEPLKQQHLLSVEDSIMTDRRYLSLLKQPWATEFAQKLADRWEGNELIGEDATESALKKALPGAYIFHLGTHALLNEKFPLHSNFVLAKEESDREDGYMHLYELYNIDCPAKLAVLTACRTGRGHWKNGEGVQSLATAFRYMGVPSVIMSLWSIDEQSSHEIVELFYQRVQAGEPLHLALSQAKRDFIRDREELHPYYWAGLILIGDSSKLDPSVLSSSILPTWIGWSLLTAIALVFTYLGMRKMIA